MPLLPSFKNPSRIPVQIRRRWRVLDHVRARSLRLRCLTHSPHLQPWGQEPPQGRGHQVAFSLPPDLRCLLSFYIFLQAGLRREERVHPPLHSYLGGRWLLSGRISSLPLLYVLVAQPFLFPWRCSWTRRRRLQASLGLRTSIRCTSWLEPKSVKNTTLNPSRSTRKRSGFIVHPWFFQKMKCW